MREITNKKKKCAYTLFEANNDLSSFWIDGISQNTGAVMVYMQLSSNPTISIALPSMDEGGINMALQRRPGE